MLLNYPGIKAQHLSPRLRDPEKNNFKLIRLVSAVLVIVSHCCGINDPVFLYTGGALSGSGIAMPVFFFLSGLLVAQSLDQSSSRRSFLWKRVLRLYPAAIAAVLVTACCIGPLVTTLPLHAYFIHPLFFRYLRTILLVQIYFHLPGVFTHSPIGDSINSSLWSLSLEWKCYAGLFLAGFIRRRPVYPLLLVLTLALLVASAVFYGPVESAGKALFGLDFALYAYSGLAAYFIIGVLCYHFRDSIAIHPWWPIAILLAGIASIRLHILDLTGFFLLPAATLYAAVYGAAIGRRLTPRPDLSYGLYVWAFPIEQLVVNYIMPPTVTLRFLLTLVLTLPLAALSWYAIEAPALALKRRRSPSPQPERTLPVIPPEPQAEGPKYKKA